MNRVDHTSPPTQTPQRIVGRYQLFEQLGAGGMGAVYRAWDSRLQRWVAIKHLSTRSDSTMKRYEHLLHEARAASALNHSAIVKIFDVFDEAGEAFLVQELIEGEPLRRRLGQPLELEFFYAFAGECVSAIAVASAQGIAHCDLKPDNIIVTPDGHARIFDFGIARHFAAPPLPDPDDPTLELSKDASGIAGTPAYLSPEVIRGLPPDSRADIFSLGVIFYEMLTGRHPFRRATLADTLVALKHDTPPAPSKWNRKTPRALDRLILHMLAKDREERLADVDALLVGLCRAREQVPRSKGSIVKPRHMVLGLVIMAAIAGVGFYTRHLRHGEAHRNAPYLAVQPFTNLSSDPQDEYYALGIMDVIRTRLATLDGIIVMGPDAEVGANVELEGTLQRAQDQLRITYRLIHRETGHILSGSAIEGPADEIFALQDEVTRELALALAIEFDLGSVLDATERPTLDVTAYDYYLQARGYLHAPEGREALEIAVQQFRRALELDPQFALAMAGMSEAYWELYAETKDPGWAERAEEAALNAQKLNPDLAGVHISLGTIHRGTGKSERAIAEFRRALEIDPRNTAAHRGLAWSLLDTGDSEGAEAAFLAAIRIQPADWAGYSHLGTFYFQQGRFVEGLAAFEKVVELTPDNAKGFRNLGCLHQSLGEIDQAIAAYERSLELQPDYRTYANLATLYRSQGRLDSAVDAYQTAIDLNNQNYLVWGALAATYDLMPGHAAEADRAYRHAIAAAEAQLAVNPQDAQLLAILAQFHSGVDERDRALELVDRALDLAPDRPDILFYVSATYEVLGERPAALDAAHKAIEAGYPASSWYQDPTLVELVADPAFERLISEGGEQ